MLSIISQIIVLSSSGLRETAEAEPQWNRLPDAVRCFYARGEASAKEV